MHFCCRTFPPVTSCIVRFRLAMAPRQRSVRPLSGVRIFGFNAFGTMLKQLRASAPFLHSSRTKDTPICVQNSDDWADAIVAMEKVKNESIPARRSAAKLVGMFAFAIADRV